MEKNKSNSSNEPKGFQQSMSAEDAKKTMLTMEKRISERLEAIDEITSQLEVYIERINELKKVKEELEENS